MALFAKSKSNLQNILNTVNEKSKDFGMKRNEEKTGTVVITNKN